MPRGARVGSDSSTRRRPSPPTPTTTTQDGPAPRGDAGGTRDNHGNLGNGRRRRETPTEGAPHQLRAPAGRRGALSAMSPLPPRPSARPAGACYATLRHGAGRDATTTATTSGPRRRPTPPRGADGARQDTDEAEERQHARRPNPIHQPPAPAPIQTAAERPYEWTSAMGVVNLGPARRRAACLPPAGQRRGATGHGARMPPTRRKMGIMPVPLPPSPPTRAQLTPANAFEESCTTR